MNEEHKGSIVFDMGLLHFLKLTLQIILVDAHGGMVKGPNMVEQSHYKCHTFNL